MRELPERIRNRNVSTIAFDYTELGLIEAMFDTAAVSFGDEDSFSWLAGGGESRYRITRTGRARAFDDGTPISTWLIEVEDNNQNLLHSYVFDGSRKEPFTQHDGSPIPYILANLTMDLAIDLQEEEAELRKSIPFRIMPGGHVIANPWYERDA